MNYHKLMFLIAAIHNYVGSLLFIFLYSKVYTIFGNKPPVPGIHYQTWIGLIFVFGVMYHMISKDRFGSKNLVILGILGKAVSASPMLFALITKNPNVPIGFVVPIITDFIFLILFFEFFITTTKKKLWKI